MAGVEAHHEQSCEGHTAHPKRTTKRCNSQLQGQIWASSVVSALYHRRHTWRGVANVMASIGIELTPAHWRMIATGERELSRHAENALRFALGYAPRRSTRIWQWSAETMKKYWNARTEYRG